MTRPKHADEKYDRFPKKAGEVYCAGCGYPLVQGDKHCLRCGRKNSENGARWTLSLGDKIALVVLAMWLAVLSIAALYTIW